MILQAQEKSKNNALLSYKPYDKQKAFHNAGKTHRTRVFLAGNRVGKSYSGSMEMSMHLTGLYPEWWDGKRFDKPIKAWAATVTAESARDILQATYLGSSTLAEDEIGSGTIPKDCIKDMSRRQGIANAIDTVRIKHTSGGFSELSFKSYDQGRAKFQGTVRDAIHLDEEPPMDVYSECATRLMTSKGHMICTMTPLSGMTDLCTKFIDEDSKYISVFHAGWDDVPWFSPEDIERMLSEYPKYEHEARRRGIPSVGAGRIYPYAEDQITVEPFDIPHEWKFVYGLDFGWRATAAVFAAIDPNTDTVYIFDEYLESELTPDQHTPILKMKGADWMNGVCDPAGQQRNQKDGTTFLDEYKQRPNNLMLSIADNSVEAGLNKCNTMFRNGKLKIFTSCPQTLLEISRYARDTNGKVIKKNDHLMDAMKYLILSGGKKARMKATRNKFMDKARRGIGSWLTV